MNLGPQIPTFGAATLEGVDPSRAVDGQRLQTRGGQYVRFYKKRIAEPVCKKALTDPKTGAFIKALEIVMEEKEKEYVHIVTPGDKNEYDGEVQEYHKQEHWKAYEAFRDGKTAPLGIPIQEMPGVSDAVINELTYRKCFTIEQLAEAGDLLCNAVPDGHILRERAKAIVKANKENQSLDRVNALQAELERKNKQFEEMQAQLQALLAERATVSTRTRKEKTE